MTFRGGHQKRIECDVFISKVHIDKVFSLKDAAGARASTWSRARPDDKDIVMLVTDT